MPFYVLKCKDCGHEEEVFCSYFQAMLLVDGSECPVCAGQPEIKPQKFTNLFKFTKEK
jgi:hypothetical protein